MSARTISPDFSELTRLSSQRHLFLTHRRMRSSRSTFSRSSRDGFIKISDSPGPGAYRASYERKRTPGAMVCGKPKDITSVSKAAIPGPGTYLKKGRPLHGSLERHDKGYSFGKKLKIKSSEVVYNPGPGTYQTHTFRKHVKKGRFGMDKKDSFNLQASSLPGPGAYLRDIKAFVPGSKIGSERRSKTRAENHPGPGAYNIEASWKRDTASLKAKSSTAAGWFTSRDTPGPGQYNIEMDSFLGSDSYWYTSQRRGLFSSFIEDRRMDRTGGFHSLAEPNPITKSRSFGKLQSARSMSSLNFEDGILTYNDFQGDHSPIVLQATASKKGKQKRKKANKSQLSQPVVKAYSPRML